MATCPACNSSPNFIAQRHPALQGDDHRRQARAAFHQRCAGKSQHAGGMAVRRERRKAVGDDEYGVKALRHSFGARLEQCPRGRIRPSPQVAPRVKAVPTA
jgi:hypothetical protein